MTNVVLQYNTNTQLLLTMALRRKEKLSPIVTTESKGICVQQLLVIKATIEMLWKEAL